MSGQIFVSVLVIAMLLCAGVGIVLWQRGRDRQQPERLLAAFLPALTLLAVTLSLDPVLTSPTANWNDLRLAPAAALMRGYGLYYLPGDGPMLDSIKDRISHSPVEERIFIMGHLKDPWWFFRALDVAVLASTENEGVPQSLVQAMFAETPIVGSDVGGIPEIVSHRQTGLLVPPSDPEALAKKIDDYLKDPILCQVCVGNALTRARQSFTINIMGKRVEGIMEGTNI